MKVNGRMVWGMVLVNMSGLIRVTTSEHGKMIEHLERENWVQYYTINVLVHIDGDEYEGDWIDDKANGRGTY